MNSMILLAAEQSVVYHRLSRLAGLTQWWQWMALGGAVLAAVVFVVWMYLRDSQELPRGIGAVLMLLRLTALGGILFFFLDLEKGAEQKLVKNSRVHILVDTSLSMALPVSYDEDNAPSRIEEVMRTLAGGELLDRLRDEHDVICYRFDQDARPVEIASLPRLGEVQTDEETDASEAELLAQRFSEARRTAGVAAALLVAALLAGLAFLLMGARVGEQERSSWALLAAVVMLISGVVTLGVSALRCPEAEFLSIVGLRPPPEAPEAEKDSIAETEADVDWAQALTTQGIETRIGDTLRYLMGKERGGPTAGVILLTDGRNNAGLGYDAAIVAARDAGIPVHTIGVGAPTMPANVRVADLEAPERVYPGDDFSLKGFVQANALQGRSVEVQLMKRAADAAKAVETLEDSQLVTLGADGVSVPVTFSATPDESGAWQYRLRVTAPKEDRQPDDNSAVARVEVMEDKSKVLLVAGGPTREYRFLRNMLFRDKDVECHVLLQTAKPGISQEADDILFEFPAIAAELFEYDCIVAFDPDWTELSVGQTELLDRWVAEQGGGMIVVAGPVFTPEWTRLRQTASRSLNTIRSLYPVTFLGRSSVSMGKVNSDQPWPLQFTRDGREAKFLWLEDDALDAESAWAEFAGVFGYYAVKDAKEGARVYAHFSDPLETNLNNEPPIFLASHFYGAGRVFFIASGEMWRLREVDLDYFQQFYTKLLRWTSQGRLLRDSNRGVLLVDRDECYVRDQVAITAVLSDAQHQPLQDPQVPALLVQPRGPQRELTLRKVEDAAREGTYMGYFSPLTTGTYRVELRASLDNLLTREVRAALPKLETDLSTRNDPHLKNLAERTEGLFYTGADLGDQAAGQLARSLDPRDQTTFLPGRLDMDFQERLMGWLMGLICGALCLEWLIRRLSKLA